MQKYIAVVNPRMDDDEISRLIAQDIAGALFEISHQNYHLAAKLIADVKRLSLRHHHPVSVIQDVSKMLDPLDLEFGLRNGIDWVVVSKPEHVKWAKKINRLAPLIWKGSKIPSDLPVDSIMHSQVSDPDASMGNLKIKHYPRPHVKQRLLETIKHMAQHAGAKAIAVSDLDEAKAFSAMRPAQKIVFMPKDKKHAHQAAIYWGVHPVFHHSDLKNRILRKGERYVDATKEKHATINTA